MALLERNRWATVIRTYPGALLVVLAPALLATELALRADLDRGRLVRPEAPRWARPCALAAAPARERRRDPARPHGRRGGFARVLTPTSTRPTWAAAGRSRLLRGALRSYWSAVLGLLPD